MVKLPPSVPCTHPDHKSRGSYCQETAVGCSQFCECCLDPFSVHTNKMVSRIKDLEEELRLWHEAADTLSYEHHYKEDPNARQKSLMAERLAEDCTRKNNIRLGLPPGGAKKEIK